MRTRCHHAALGVMQRRPDGRCLPCARGYDLARSQKPERKAATKASNLKHRDETNARRRERTRSDPDYRAERNAHSRKHYAANAETLRAYAREYRKAPEHKTRAQEYQREYITKPGKVEQRRAHKAAFDARHPGYATEASKKRRKEKPEETKAYGREVMRRHRAANPAKARADWNKVSHKKQGIVFPEGATVESLSEEQNWLCPICDESLLESAPKFRHVDHDHSITDGRPNVRGILHSWCNTGLGMLKDSPARVAAAFEYLMRPMRG